MNKKILIKALVLGFVVKKIWGLIIYPSTFLVYLIFKSNIIIALFKLLFEKTLN